MTSNLKKIYLKILQSIGFKTNPELESSFIRNICKFVVNECIDGDYYEFGVYKGDTLLSFYKCFQSVGKKRLSRTDQVSEKLAFEKRNIVKDEMIFHAFDSFEGLPELSSGDKGTLDFQKGQYTESLDAVVTKLTTAGMPERRFLMHPGWFNETCNNSYMSQFSYGKASVIWLDCDLYSSARDALSIFPSLLQPGTVIVIDDWFCFKGNPNAGVQRAWREFIEDDNVACKFGFNEYLTDSWSRKSFICYLLEG